MNPGKGLYRKRTAHRVLVSGSFVIGGRYV